jgi:hypothetical protein
MLSALLITGLDSIRGDHLEPSGNEPASKELSWGGALESNKLGMPGTY